MTEEYFQEEHARLKAKHTAIMADANEHKDDFEYFMVRIDEAIAACDKMAKLDSEHKKLLIDQMDKRSLGILQEFINKLFGVGA